MVAQVFITSNTRIENKIKRLSLISRTERNEVAKFLQGKKRGKLKCLFHHCCNPKSYNAFERIAK